MDLNFSKAQESILRMTQGQDRTAIIVTSGGMIAGYTDMSLLGEGEDPAALVGQIGDSGAQLSMLVNDLSSYSGMLRARKGSSAAEELSREGDDSILRFTMQDTGVGMDKDFLPKIFEAFAQGEGAAANRYGGTGLGMAITKNIVDMMGGEIAVESEKGVGSTFTVTLKLRRAAAAAAPLPEAAAPLPETAAQSAQPASLAGRHVLVAEDIEQNAEILIDLLEMEEVTAEWVDNGERAVDCFSKSEPGHFDAILMDMRMPVMDGLEATRAIRRLERPDAETVPIVALTANAFEEDVQQCLQSGMNAHLSKPVDVDLLMQTLGRLCAAAEETAGADRRGTSTDTEV